MQQRVVIGEVSGVYGVLGWLRVRSHTEPAEQILRYAPWLLRRTDEWVTLELAGGRLHGGGVVAKLAGVEDRDEARRLVGAEIAVDRSQLPLLEPDDYYWNDVIGSSVVTCQGVELGRVISLMATGANDVLVVEGDKQRLIPFVRDDVVMAVDLDSGRIEVDWDPDF